MHVSGHWFSQMTYYGARFLLETFNQSNSY